MNFGDDITLIIIIALSSYFFGSIPFGLLLTKLGGISNLREIGSGNIGATNVLRTGKKGLAFFTLVLDIGKGFGAVIVTSFFGVNYAMIASICVVVGHIFPVWLKFKGGKGVATAIGVLLAIDWILGSVFIVTWLIVGLIFRYSSLASLSAFILTPGYAWWFMDVPIFFTSCTISVIGIYRHTENIRRLISKQEGKIKLKNSCINGSYKYQ